MAKSTRLDYFVTEVFTLNNHPAVSKPIVVSILATWDRYCMLIELCAELTHFCIFLKARTSINNVTMTATAVIFNKSNSVVHCFVSKYSNSNGDDSWFGIDPGTSADWGRAGWELVAFKDSSDSTRAGIYLQINRDRTIEFHAFNDIRVIV